MIRQITGAARTPQRLFWSAPWWTPVWVAMPRTSCCAMRATRGYYAPVSCLQIECMRCCSTNMCSWASIAYYDKCFFSNCTRCFMMFYCGILIYLLVTVWRRCLDLVLFCLCSVLQWVLPQHRLQLMLELRWRGGLDHSSALSGHVGAAGAGHVGLPKGI